MTTGRLWPRVLLSVAFVLLTPLVLVYWFIVSIAVLLDKAEVEIDDHEVSVNFKTPRSIP